MTKEKIWEQWDKKKKEQFQQTFIEWYEREKRNLPWRVNQDPYRIWISEIMLQQTRVETVIDYFYRFMEWFPTIEDLANAPEDKLLKSWEGLGYYSRVRNIQAAAKQIIEEHDGKMPDTIEEISKLKGIGPYTAGAIGSIAFGLPEPAIDGNVMRVVSRLFCIEEDIAKTSSRKIFDEAMRAIIDEQHPGEFNQALMDLGSRICKPTSPKCEECPIQTYCSAFSKGIQTDFPVKSKKAKPKNVYYLAGAIENNDGEFYLKQREKTGLLANMWTFPLIEVSEFEYQTYKRQWEKEAEMTLFDSVAEDEELTIFPEYPVIWQKRHLGEVTHIFSHLKWHILLFYGRSKKEFTTENRSQWLVQSDFNSLVFPKPQMKLVEQLKKNETHGNH